jgi:hypothetical protein
MMRASAKPMLILAGGATIFLISALLFGLPQVRRAAQIGAAARARLQLDQWVRMAEAYRQAHGVLPAGEGDGVLELMRADAAARGAMKDERRLGTVGQVLDPWGTAWRIRDGERLEVRSAGPNGEFGDEDDLSSLGVR